MDQRDCVYELDFILGPPVCKAVSVQREDLICLAAFPSFPKPCPSIPGTDGLKWPVAWPNDPVCLIVVTMEALPKHIK